MFKESFEKTEIKPPTPQGKEVAWGLLETPADAMELFELRDAFGDIADVRRYFKDNKEALSGIGVTDVIGDTKNAMDKIGIATKKLAKGNKALEKMLATKLRFSADFLGETIREINGVLEDLDGIVVSLFRDVAESMEDPDSLIGRLVGEQKKKDLITFNLLLKNFGEAAKPFQSHLSSLVDLTLTSYSNNDLLNQYLRGEAAVDKFMAVYNAIEKVRKYTKYIPGFKS